ncbi:MAG: hypothetical protein WCQ21_15905 [Verrucomicrobiota bacterium]|jgi:hypothetical protein
MIGMVPAPQTGAANITSLYAAAFGAPAVGKRLFVQVYQVQDGWESIPDTFTAVVPVSAKAPHRPLTGHTP